MKYYINYDNNSKKILGFLTNLNLNYTDGELVEVSKEIWDNGMFFNKIILDGEGINFEKVDWRTPQELELIAHKEKSALVDNYVENLIITTSSGKRFKANYSALSSMDIILKGDFPDGLIPIWKQNINNELVYYENLPLSELSEVIQEANKRIQAKHAEIFLNTTNPYNEVNE